MFAAASNHFGVQRLDFKLRQQVIISKIFLIAKVYGRAKGRPIFELMGLAQLLIVLIDLIFRRTVGDKHGRFMEVPVVKQKNNDKE